MTQQKQPMEQKSQQAQPQQAKNANRKTLVILIVAAVILALTIAGMILGAAKRRQNETAMQAVVVRCEDTEITNQDFNYYYWSEYFYFVGAVTDNLPGFDPSVSPARQSYDDTRSWEDYFIERTLIAVRDTTAMAMAARQAGFTLPEDYAESYEKALADFDDAAAGQGYADVDGYLRASFGAGATREGFAAYLLDTYLSAAYADELYDTIDLRDADIESYYALHEADYADCADGLAEAGEDLRAERYRNLFLTLTDAFPFEVNYNAITLFQPRGLFQK